MSRPRKRGRDIDGVFLLDKACHQMTLCKK